MATKNFPISGATSSSTKDWSYTISKSDINTWIEKNIPANATISSAVIYCNCSKTASTATGTLEITVGGAQAHFAEKEITVGSYNPKAEIASFINSSNQISGDVVFHFFFYNTGSLTGTPKWTVSSGNITFTYEEHVHTPGSSATCTTAQTCTVCGATITAALGHSYGSPTYTWSADGKTCTAKRVCSNNSSHTETATATITSAVKTAATCTEKGTTRYTATFSASWASTQTKDIQDILETDHSYTDVVTQPTRNELGYTTHTCECGDSIVDTYTCLATFENYDGSEIKTEIVEMGGTPTAPPEPSRAGYEFVYWLPDVGEIHKSTVFRAVFEKIPQQVYSGTTLTSPYSGNIKVAVYVGNTKI